MSAFYRQRVLAAIALLSLGACSGSPEILLISDRPWVAAGGFDFVRITATAMMGDDPVGAGTKVSFSTTAGSFDQNSELTDTEIATNAAGEALVKLYSSKGTGEATVTASFYDDASGLEATTSLSIRFDPPLAVDGSFRITCDAVNIGALREPVPDIKVTCQISAQSRRGATIPSTALSPEFYTEAGTMTPKTDTYSGEKVFIYSPKGGASTPRDVGPNKMLNEPSYPDGNGRERNPRDGLATIIAVIRGEEAFTDANGNNRHDPGEPFIDAAEPFVDVDDDDQWDPDEKYVDNNNNGKWDLANGKWDNNAKIMAIYKILWTGKLDNAEMTSRIGRLSSVVPDGGKLELAAFVLDANMNPVAAFQKNQDYIEWSLSSGSSDASSNDPTSPPMSNALGFSFDKAALTERKRWMIVSNSFTPAPYKFTVEDGYPGDRSPPSSFTLSAQVYITPGPAGEDYFLPQVTEKIGDQVQGMCD